MKKRKPLRFQNRYWKRTPGGGYCDSCHILIQGFLSPHVNKKTKKRLCEDCYLEGY